MPPCLTTCPEPYFDIQGDANDRYVFYYAAGTFNNAGTLKKTAGAAKAYFYMTLNNTGTVDIQAGVLELRGGSAISSALVLTAGGELNFNGGTHDLNAGFGHYRNRSN